ncbi:MAG: amidohydrolase, partial [Romboutsia sp.]
MLEEKVKLLSSKYYEKTKEIRELIHMYPEDGFLEFKTSKLIIDELEKLGIEVRSNVAKTGVVGLLRGSKPGKTVMLRADMDALKLEEKA